MSTFSPPSILILIVSSLLLAHTHSILNNNIPYIITTIHAVWKKQKTKIERNEGIYAEQHFIILHVIHAWETNQYERGFADG